MRKFVEEAKRLAKFQNEPGIVRIYDSFEANNTAYIVMEFLDGETLDDYLKELVRCPWNRQSICFCLQSKAFRFSIKPG